MHVGSLFPSLYFQVCVKPDVSLSVEGSDYIIDFSWLGSLCIGRRSAIAYCSLMKFFMAPESRRAEVSALRLEE